jgi:hypothetical protein
VAHKLGGDPPDLDERQARVEGDDRQRPLEPLQVLAETKDLAAEGPHLLSDRYALQEAEVVDRNGQFLARNESAAEIGERCGHAWSLADLRAPTSRRKT